jgi:hypothetical protein
MGTSLPGEIQKTGNPYWYYVTAVAQEQASSCALPIGCLNKTKLRSAVQERLKRRGLHVVAPPRTHVL